MAHMDRMDYKPMGTTLGPQKKTFMSEVELAHQAVVQLLGRVRGLKDRMVGAQYEDSQNALPDYPSASGLFGQVEMRANEIEQMTREVVSLLDAIEAQLPQP